MPPRLNGRASSASHILNTLVFALLVAGCRQQESSATLLAEAEKYEQKGDFKAALIQLKNAAVQNPDNAEVRIKLARLYNVTGNAPSAEKEVRKAISLGAAKGRTNVELTNALLRQGQAQKAIDVVRSETDKLGPELYALRGDAFLSLNKPDQAREAYRQALVTKPGYTEALIGMARLALIDNDPIASQALINKAIVASPKDPAPYFFKGLLLRARPAEHDEAIAAFSQTIALKPDHVNALVERATLQIGARKFDAAKADLNTASKIAPNSMQVLYAQALFEFRLSNFAKAEDILQKILSIAPDHMPSLLLAGASELELGTLKHAAHHLQKYVEYVKEDLYARKLLAQVQLRSTEPAAAAHTLMPALKDDTKDVQLLTLAGESAQQTGDFKTAAGYFERAINVAPNLAGLHTLLGLAWLGNGNVRDALVELEQAVALDSKSEVAASALVRAHLRLGKVEKAVIVVKTLIDANPESAAAQGLAGTVYMAAADNRAARASFERQLSLAPTSSSAVLSLAQIDINDGKPDAAKQRLTGFLTKDSKNSIVMAAIAALELNQKRPQDAVVWLEKAHADSPTAVQPAIRLARFYLHTNQVSKALNLTRNVQLANPGNAELLELLGQIQQANNDQSGALETYNKLVSVMPTSADARFHLATAHLKLKNEVAAAEDLKKALAIDPHFMQAKLGQVDIAIATGNSGRALTLIQQIQKDHATSPVGYLLEGDLLVAQGKTSQAISSYQRAFVIAGTPQVLIKLSRAMKSAGQTAEANAKLAQWMKEHPAETLVPLYTAENALALKQYKTAIAGFEDIIHREPANVVALNNLAWAYLEDKDVRALATAERAFKLAGDNPSVLDTFGWVLVQHGNVARGLPILQRAASTSPDSSDIRYHLALGLNRSGDKVNARKLLQQLLVANGNFAQADEARILLKQL